MKWLLITTLSKNPGDEFARIGVQNLIRMVDPAATFDICCKESPSIFQPRPFDVAVICGMPLVWSLPHNECQDINWWKPIFHDWIFKAKKPILALGVGAITVGKLNNFDRYCSAVKEVLEKTALFTVRQPVFVHPQIVDTICPSAFAIPGTLNSGDLNVCNLMPHGGHHMCAETQHAHMQAWYDIQTEVAEALKAENFKFVAHTHDELEYSRRLGWSSENTFYSLEPRNYLDIYSRARCFIGNRLHGAAVVASLGRPVLGIAADSRTAMVKRLGGKTVTPLGLKDLLRVNKSKLCALPARIPTPYTVSTEQQNYFSLIRSAVKSPA